MGRDVFLPIEDTERKQDLSATMGPPTGRPRLDFTTSSDRTKRRRRRSESLKSQISVEELSHATQMGLQSQKLLKMLL